jgi:hypothetical protein
LAQETWTKWDYHVNFQSFPHLFLKTFYDSPKLEVRVCLYFMISSQFLTHSLTQPFIHIEEQKKPNSVYFGNGLSSHPLWFLGRRIQLYKS